MQGPATVIMEGDRIRTLYCVQGRSVGKKMAVRATNALSVIQLEAAAVYESSESNVFARVQDGLPHLLRQHRNE